MRLSEHMMLGTVLMHHSQGRAGDGDTMGCALKLAQKSIGSGSLTRPCSWVSETFSWTNRYITCPQCDEYNSIWSIIAMHLNDEHAWTIEKIADWVRSVEPAEPEVSEETIANEMHELAEVTT